VELPDWQGGPLVELPVKFHLDRCNVSLPAGRKTQKLARVTRPIISTEYRYCLHGLKTAKGLLLVFPLSLLVWYMRQTKLASCQFLSELKIIAYLLTAKICKIT